MNAHCIFDHAPCRYGAKCVNEDCGYEHPEKGHIRRDIVHMVGGQIEACGGDIRCLAALHDTIRWSLVSVGKSSVFRGESRDAAEICISELINRLVWHEECEDPEVLEYVYGSVASFRP